MAKAKKTVEVIKDQNPNPLSTQDLTANDGVNDVKDDAKDESNEDLIVKDAGGRFKLLDESIIEGAVSIVSITKKRSLHFNRGTTDIDPTEGFPKGVPVANSKLMKEIYDSNPVWKNYIQAPSSYVAPWEKA